MCAAQRLAGDGAVGGVGGVALPVEAPVPVGATLRAALAAVLQTDSGWVAVVDGERYAGVLTRQRARGGAQVGDRTPLAAPAAGRSAPAARVRRASSGSR